MDKGYPLSLKDVPLVHLKRARGLLPVGRLFAAAAINSVPVAHLRGGRGHCRVSATCPAAQLPPTLRTPHPQAAPQIAVAPQAQLTYGAGHYY